MSEFKSHMIHTHTANIKYAAYTCKVKTAKPSMQESSFKFVFKITIRYSFTVSSLSVYGKGYLEDPFCACLSKHDSKNVSFVCVCVVCVCVCSLCVKWETAKYFTVDHIYIYIYIYILTFIWTAEFVLKVD